MMTETIFFIFQCSLSPVFCFLVTVSTVIFMLPGFPVFPVFSVPVSLWTDAAVAIQMVDALSSVLTAMVNTFIIIYTAVWPHPAWNTHTPGTHTHILHDTWCRIWGSQHRPQRNVPLYVCVCIFNPIWDLKLC